MTKRNKKYLLPARNFIQGSLQFIISKFIYSPLTKIPLHPIFCYGLFKLFTSWECKEFKCKKKWIFHETPFHKRTNYFLVCHKPTTLLTCTTESMLQRIRMIILPLTTTTIAFQCENRFFALRVATTVFTSIKIAYHFLRQL